MRITESLQNLGRSVLNGTKCAVSAVAKPILHEARVINDPKTSDSALLNRAAVYIGVPAAAAATVTAVAFFRFAVPKVALLAITAVCSLPLLAAAAILGTAVMIQKADK